MKQGVFLCYSSPCLNHCIFCAHKTNRHSPLASIKKKLEENRSLKIRRLSLVSNEPLSHPRIKEIFDHARACGFEKIEILTSGELLSSLTLTKELVSKGLETVSLSLYGIGKIHDKIVRRPGGFEDSMRAVRNLKNAGCQHIYIHSLLLNQNIGHYKKFLSFLRKKVKLPLSVLHTRPKYPVFSYKKMMPPYSSIIRVFKNSNLNFIGYPLCVLKEIAPRRFREIVSAAKRNDEVPEDTSMNTFFYSKINVSVKLPACRSCGIATLCPGVIPEYARVHGDREIQPL